MPNKPYLTSIEVAALLRVSPVTIRQWAQKGMLDAEYTPGGHRRFLIHEIQRFATEHGISLHDNDSSGQRILIVDDDASLAQYMVDMFESIAGEQDLELQIEVAEDGFEAGGKVFRFRPHIMLLDLLMPGMDGFAVCRSLKSSSETKNIRVIAMTGFDSEENVRKIIDAGAEACIAKPIDRVALIGLLGLDKKSRFASLTRR